jgi:hypothetical protein
MHLVETCAICRNCGRENPVVTLGARIEFQDFEDTDFKFYMLFGIRKMPEELLQALRTDNPGYGLYFDDKEDAYYLNACGGCGAAYQEQYLNIEPGDPFAPFDAEDYDRITVTDLEFSVPYEVLEGNDDVYRTFVGIEADAWNPDEELANCIAE